MKRPYDMLMESMGKPTDGNTCVNCNSDKMKPEDFRDEICRREAKLSYMCQKCQDKAFAPHPDDEKTDV